jgi:hypothetical protein
VSFATKDNFLLSTFNWQVQKSAWSENRLSFSAANFRGNQLNEQGLILTLLFLIGVKFFSKILFFKGIIQL